MQIQSVDAGEIENWGCVTDRRHRRCLGSIPLGPSAGRSLAGRRQPRRREGTAPVPRSFLARCCRSRTRQPDHRSDRPRHCASLSTPVAWSNGWSGSFACSQHAGGPSTRILCEPSFLPSPGFFGEVLRYSQLSMRRPGTLTNSRMLCVTSRTLRLSACAAMSRSIAPIICPFFSSVVRNLP